MLEQHVDSRAADIGDGEIGRAITIEIADAEAEQLFEELGLTDEFWALR